MVQAALDAACAEMAGCGTLAFADLSTHMVLMTNSDAPLSQDQLNELCVEAGKCLNDGNLALVADHTETRLFLRSSQEPDDALFCVLDPGCDLKMVLPAVQDCLTQIAGGSET